MCTLEHLDWLICRYLSKEVCFVIRCNLWTNRLAAMWLLARYWGLLFGLGQVFVLLFHDFNFIQVLFQGEFWRLDMLEPNFFWARKLCRTLRSSSLPGCFKINQNQGKMNAWIGFQNGIDTPCEIGPPFSLLSSVFWRKKKILMVVSSWYRRSVIFGGFSRH